MVQNALGRWGATMLAVLLAAGLAGCNGTIGALEPMLTAEGGGDADVEGQGYRKIGKPYKIGGRWYTPQEDEDYDEVGKASWYGKRFHGKRTANGERFDKDKMTAAHPTLPLPSYVRVTVVESGKSEVLRVNDRGPFKRGRIIDVSRAAAEKLGFRNAGRAKVRVQYLGPAPVNGQEADNEQAAAELEEEPKKRGFFGFGEPQEDEGEVEVRLAAPGEQPVGPASAATGDGSTPVASIAAPGNDPVARPKLVAVASPVEALPGVRVPASTRPTADPALAPVDGDPLSAIAYQDEDDGGAVDALIALSSEDETPPEPAAPLPEEAVEMSGERVMGAHDLFGDPAAQ